MRAPVKKEKQHYIKQKQDMVTTIRINRSIYDLAKANNINISKVTRDALVRLLVED